MSGALGVVKRHLTGLTMVSAGVLGVLGVLLALGLLPAVTSAVEGLFAAGPPVAPATANRTPSPPPDLRTGEFSTLPQREPPGRTPTP